MLELKKVTKRYSGVQEIEIFNEVDLKVDKGEMVSIVAPSGNGKSTLIKITSVKLSPGRFNLLAICRVHQRLL